MSNPYGPPPSEDPTPEGQPRGEQPSGQPQYYGQPAYSQPETQPAYGQQPAYAQQPTYGQPGGGALTPDERTWGGAAHWSALVAAFLALAFLGPLIVLLVKGNESAWVRRQAVESLNFQISVLIYAIISGVLLLLLIGFILLPIVGIFWLVFTIIGSVKASNGEDYRYPLTIRMVS